MDAMGAIGLGIVLSLQDKVSSGLEQIQQRLASFSGASEQMLKKFDQGAKDMLGGVASMIGGVKVFGTFGSVFGSSVDTAMSFEQAMARVGAVSGATGEDFERLTAQAKELGATTQFSASQAAASQENLARAGFSTEQIIAAMPGLLNMAAAEGMELASAADIASSAIAGFGLDASEAGRVADVLAKTSAASNTSIALLGESLKYVAPYAKAVGVDIESTNAMLGVMANAGIKGSQAGNALKSAFSRLSEEPAAVAKALKSVGVEAKTSTGELRPFPELMKDLSEKMGGMGKAEKVGLFNKIFGAVAGGGMLAIMDGVANGSLPELTSKLYGASGAAKEMADRMNATAQGAMLQLESASEGLRIAIGNHLIPVYTWAILKMAAFKGWLTKLIDDHPILTKAVIGLTAAITALIGGMLIVVGVMKLVSGFMKVWPMMRIAARLALSNIRTEALNSMSALKVMGGPVMWLIGIAGALYLAWRKNFMGIRDMVSAITNGFKMAVSASKDGIAEVDNALYEELQKAGIWDFAVIMGKVFFRVRQFAEGFIEGFMQGIEKIKGAARSVADFFSPLIEGGKTLLNMLGLFKPIADMQVDSWRKFGKAVGEVIPYVIALFGAFKALGMAKSIIGGISSALSLITAHPIIAIVVAAVAMFTYLYSHFEGFRNFVNGVISRIVNIFSDAFDVIKGICNTVIGILTGDWEKFSNGVKSIFTGFVNFIGGIVKLIAAPFLWVTKLISDNWDAVVNGIKFLINGFVSFIKGIVNFILAPFKWLINLLTGNWGGLVDGMKAKTQWFTNWWNSWSLSDIFAPLSDLAVSAINIVKTGWKGVVSWFGKLSLPNIFAKLGDFASSAVEKIKGIWTKFAKWISDLNPFKNWKAPTPEEVEKGKQKIIEEYGTLDWSPSHMKGLTQLSTTQPVTNIIKEKTATVTTNNVTSEKLVENNRTQELQIVPQAPVTQNIQQLLPTSKRETIPQATSVNKIQPLWERQAILSGSPTIRAAVDNLPTNTITEHVEKIIKSGVIPLALAMGI